MAYAIKYLFKFESSNGTTREIRVLKDGYTGEVIQRPLGRAPILKKQQNGPVHGTSLEFFAECNVDREFIEFYTSDPKAYRVDLYAGATLLWQGYITPELYSEPDIAPPYDVQVVATDGVGELKLYNYAAQGTVTLRALLSGLLARTGLGTDVYLISSLKPGSRGAGALLDMTINLDYMAGKTCYETLTYILDTLHATITWWKGAWILTRETNVTFTSGKVRYFNTAGNSALLADSVQVLGKMYSDPAWPVGQLSTVIDPAKNRVAVQAPWHVVTCLQNSDMASDASWAKSNDASYGPDGYLFPNNDEGTSTYATAYISQALAMEGLRVPMSFELRATGVSAQVGVRVGAVIGVLLTYTVGNVVYHLRKGSEGAPEWTPGPAIGTSIDGSLVDYQRPLASFDMDRIQAETLQITDIPAFVQGTSYPAGTLTVYILGTCARLYAATLDVVLPKGYQDILRIGNGARGEGNEVEVAIGRETTDNAYYAAFLQGLLLDSGNLITSFADANFPAGMDYLAFIARDYALSVALPRAKVTGTVYLESGIAAPPLVFTKGALNYWLQTWSWNLYEDELEIEGLTLPSASLTVESETILEANGSTVSSAGSTGSSGPVSSMGSSTNYWEIDGTLDTLLKPKDAYSYIGVKDGIFFSGATEADFEVQTINGQRVIHSRLPFYSDSFISAGGLSDGGGGEGGLTWAALAAPTSEQINLSHLTGALGGYYTKAQVDALIGSIDLSGYVQHADLLPLAEAIAANDLRIRSFEDWLLNPSFDDLPVYSLSAQELNLGGYLFDGEGIDLAISLAGTAIQPADLKQLTFQSGVFAAISYNPASPATVNIPSSITHLTDANRVSALEGRFDANGKLNFANLPALYIARTQVKSSAANDVLLGITAISNAASSDDTDKSRIEWDETNNAWHFIGSLYADGFVSAGGLSTGGGEEGATLEAVWASLTTNTDEYAGLKIDLNHLPYTAGAGISITNGIISATNAGAVTSIKLGTTPYNPVSGVVSLPAYPTTLPASDVYDWAKAATKPSYAFSEITGTLAVTQVPTIPISKTLGLEAALAAKMDLDSEIPLTEGIATNDRRIASLEDWLLSPALDALSVYSLDAEEISLAGDMLGDYLTALSDGIIAEAQARSDADDTINGAITTLGSRTTTLEGYFTGGSAKSAQTAARLSGNTSYTAWGQTYWSNGVPGSISGDMTSVGSISMNGAISGATTISASGQASVGSLKLASGAPTLTWDSANSAWHLSGNFYADGFISAGGVSSGGGASGIDLAAMWSSLTNATSDPYANYKIAAAHIPDMASTYGYATQTWVGQQGYLTSASLSGYATQTWVNSQGFVTSSGVTSVGLSAPTGFSVTGSPVTSSGTLALTFASGYSLPTTAKQTNWDTAYGWGNHASAGYLTTTTAAATYETIANANLSELSLAEGISSNEDRLTALEGWLASPALDELLVRSFGADEVETGRLLAESASISAISLAGADLATTLSGYALKTTTVTGTGYLTGGGDLSANRTIDIASTYKTRIDNGNTAYGWGNHASAGYLTASAAASTYVTLSTAQTISGSKTFSATLYGADSEWSDGRSTLRLIAANGYTYIQSSTAAHDASADMYLTGLYGGVGSYLYLRFSNVHAYSNIVADGAITAGSASARELKQNIKPLSRERALDIVMNSNPVTFEWNALATSLYDKLSGADIGLIAQEIEPYVPSAIGTIFEKYKRLDYTKLIAPILCVEKDHERRIAALERENKELRKRLNMN